MLGLNLKQMHMCEKHGAMPIRSEAATVTPRALDRARPVVAAPAPRPALTQPAPRPIAAAPVAPVIPAAPERITQNPVDATRVITRLRALQIAYDGMNDSSPRDRREFRESAVREIATMTGAQIPTNATKNVDKHMRTIVEAIQAAVKDADGQALKLAMPRFMASHVPDLK